MKHRAIGGLASLTFVALVSACTAEPPSDTFRKSASALSAYVGCFVDRGDRAFPVQLSGRTNVACCRELAYYSGYRYAALQYGGECWAGNTLGYERAPEEDCNMPCSFGKDGDTCGGSWRNSVYIFGEPEAAPPPPSGSTRSDCHDGSRFTGLGWFDQAECHAKARENGVDPNRCAVISGSVCWGY